MVVPAPSVTSGSKVRADAPLFQESLFQESLFLVVNAGQHQ